MKKLISIVSAMILLTCFTACDGLIGQSESEEYIQEVADKTIEMVTDYYNGMRSADIDLTFKDYPQFYLDTLDNELEYYDIERDAYLNPDNATWYTSNYGEDATISFEVVSTTLMTKSVTKKYNDLIANLYQSDTGEVIECVYMVSVDKTISGDIKTTTENEMWTVFQIDGNYYLYDDYYEKLAEEESQ